MMNLKNTKLFILALLSLFASFFCSSIKSSEVEASSMYYWSKYNNRIETSAGTIKWEGVPTEQAANGSLYHYGLNDLYSSFSVQGNIIVGTGTKVHTYGQQFTRTSGTFYNIFPTSTIVYKIVILSNDGDWLRYTSQSGTIAAPSTTSNVRGSLIQSDIQAGYNAYLHNQLNPDGFWYVRGAIADTTPPTGTLTQNPTNFTNQNVIITATGTDTDSGMKRIKLPSGSYTSSSSYAHTVSENGTYTFVFEDNAGNTYSRSITVSNIDQTNPTATFTPNGNSTYQKSHTAKLTTTDSASGVNTRQYAWSSSNTTTPTTWSNFTEGQTLSTPNGVTGNRYLWVKVTDNAGNELITKSNVFRLDNTAPNITFTPDSIEPTFKGMEVHIVITDNGGSNYKEFRYAWTKDETRPTEGWSEWDVKPNPLIAQDKGGKWFLHMEATDHAGNIGYAHSGIYEKIVVSGGPSININVFPTPTGAWHNKPIDAYVMDSGDTELLAKAKKNYEVTNSPLYPNALSKTIPADKKIQLNLQGENFVHVQYILDDGTKISATAGPYLLDTGAVGDFEMKVVNVAGVKVTDWTNQNLRLVLSNPTGSPVSGFKKQYRMEGLHTDWQSYTDDMTITTEGNYRIFGRIINGTGTSSEQKIVQAFVDKTNPTVNQAHLQINANNTYDVTIQATDALSSVKEVTLNNGIVLSAKGNTFTANALAVKPTSVTVKDQAGNTSGAITFEPEPTIQFQSPYSLTVKNYREDIVVQLSNATRYQIGKQATHCLEAVCQSTITKNTTMTAVKENGIKQTSKVIAITNLDKSALSFVLSGKRNLTTPTKLEFEWNYSLTSGHLICTENGTQTTHVVTGSNYSFTGKNAIYECFVEGSYGNETIQSNKVMVFVDSSSPSDDGSIIEKVIKKTNVHLDENSTGDAYMINTKRDNYKRTDFPFPKGINGF